MSSVSFSGQFPKIPHLSNKELADLRGDVEAGFQLNESYTENGVYSSATLKIGTLPTATNTVTIGADVYEFGGTGSNKNVAIGAAPANSIANLVAAINSVGAANVKAEAVTVPTTGVAISLADAPGGNLVKGTASIALSETLSAGADVWNQANLNATGKTNVIRKTTTSKVVIDATNVASAFVLKLDFTPSVILWQAYASTGAPKTNTATVTASGQNVLVTAGAGGTPLVATDFIVITAIE